MLALPLQVADTTAPIHYNVSIVCKLINQIVLPFCQGVPRLTKLIISIGNQIDQTDECFVSLCHLQIHFRLI